MICNSVLIFPVYKSHLHCILHASIYIRRLKGDPLRVRYINRVEQSQPDDRHKYSPYLVLFAKAYRKIYAFFGVMVRRSLPAPSSNYINGLGLAYYRELANSVLRFRVLATDLTLCSFMRYPLNAYPSGV